MNQASRYRRLWVETPVLESVSLGWRHHQVSLKIEAMQPSGSFKARGIGHACATHVANGVTHLVAASGGNAGQAAAWAGRMLNVPVDIVVPDSTGQRARELIEAEGANVTIHGESFAEAHVVALSKLKENSAYLHAYDDSLVWDGHASMIDEAARQTEQPDAIVLSVGGGGMLAGVAAGMARNGWSDVDLVAVETDGANALNASIESSEPVTLERIDSVAVTLGAKRICDRALELAGVLARTPATPDWRGQLSSELVSDREALAACLAFADDHRLVVEPACGAALAPVYAKAPCLDQYDRILVVVCGGTSMTFEMLKATAASL